MFEKLKHYLNFRQAQFHDTTVTVRHDTRRFFFRPRGRGWIECSEQAYRALHRVGYDIDLAVIE